MTQTKTKTKTSKIALWKSRKPGKATHFGKISLNAEAIEYLSSATPNAFGEVELDVLLFKNDRGGHNAPGHKGYVNPPRNKQNEEEPEF